MSFTGPSGPFTEKGNIMRERPLHTFFPASWKVFLSCLGVTAASFLLILYVDRPFVLMMRDINPGINHFFSYVTLLGISAPYLVLTGIIFILFYPSSRAKRWQDHAPTLRKYALSAFFIFVSIALSGLLTDVLKIVFARYRPMMLYRSGHYGFVFFKSSPARVLSFPSGHANTIAALATALYFIKPRYLFFYIFIALMVMASRVIIGEHFLSDVLVGGYLGVVTTFYLKGFFEYHRIDIFVNPPESGVK